MRSAACPVSRIRYHVELTLQLERPISLSVPAQTPLALHDTFVRFYVETNEPVAQAATERRAIRSLTDMLSLRLPEFRVTSAVCWPEYLDGPPHVPVVGIPMQECGHHSPDGRGETPVPASS